MSYADSIIQECISTKFLANRNIWHVKVLLIVFAMIEMHEFGQVMRQLRFRQSILSSPQDIKELHKVDLQGRTDEDWAKFHAKYIYILEHRYDFIPMRKPILAPDLATSPCYRTWFRHYGNPYLL
ncbi:hypothetical protein CXB51_026237 [Gossypium anomalum]|uniref:Uncharacterized protein n=1 Tax=Gossypium anomalum TaxID=47600 RepID=A0A8J6CR17_9ROSI|nr:hypothetical protein CXB51_026237 [Gossypium anomalum]